ncbi:hypothetical protein, partial [Aeromonas caviae]|uniref:hypothetical protein n=1 Tax=Aeromonas caviae TaxID=648 RepID=UPI001F21004D
MIKKTEYTHILPLMLDAIFEGDFEDESRNDILKFISKNKPSDQQLIFSIADSKTNALSAEHYNKSHFQGSAKLICIGQNSRTREGANKRGNSSRLTQSFHFFMFEPIFFSRKCLESAYLDRFFA